MATGTTATESIKTMGRPKRGATQPEKPERPPDLRVAIIHLKGTVEYSDWLEAAYKKTHIPKATMFRLAMADWAVKNGLEPPPEL